MIAVTGASGLVGTALAAAGDDLRALPRPGPGLDPALLAGCAAVVHLAGASVGQRWTAAHRAAIRDSRVQGTAAVARACAAAGVPVLVCASATGFYGDAGESVCSEAAPPGRGFLATVCQEWEAAAAPARAAGVRVVHLRLGVVLSRRGGALARMLPAFRLGLGGPLGDGRQWMPWIALDDVVAVIRRAVADPLLEGPVNTVAGALRQGDFARALGAALHRPACLRAPAFALKALLGDQARELLLTSCRAEPARLLALGHRFLHPELGPALQAETA